LRALDLDILAHAGLAEDGQQHRGAIRREPVRDPYIRAVQRGTQLADTLTKVAGIGVAQASGVLCEQTDVLVDLDAANHRTSGSSSMPNS
jgi:hypothetical protein